ncbi:glycosyltransferase family 2 protein [Hymenobacter persicinus]|uniref:glycosyltransferase family 2 protein n=1 Tax=Hymenobacter persicinus TaxID=2025506 RepID=UPI001A935AD3|nr:nucleotide-diphospho-sugar transferase [Hymenobacter persicinus]
MSTPFLPPPAPEADTPVLLIVFNRPQSTQRVLEAIRQARPGRLYVAADGPRPNRPGEAARCAETRAVLTAGIDWPCRVQTLFRDENLGCGRGPAAAIQWFFELEPEGIILEDDCVPTPGFFPFCRELLARYRHDTRVMHIGGNNLAREAAQPLTPAADSYYFSGRVNSWGWATWRRAWQHFDFQFRLLPALQQRGLLRAMYPSVVERQYWLRKFEAVLRGPQPPHIWDYQWHFTVAAHSGLTIVPAVNLVSNIGFGDDATHTFDAADRLSGLATGELLFPLQHPPTVLRDWARDQRHFREHLTERAVSKARRLLGRLLPAAPAAAESAAPRTTGTVPHFPLANPVTT